MIEQFVGPGLALAGGLLGQLLAGKDRKAADRIMAQVRDEFGRIDPAKVEQLAAIEMDPEAETGMRDSLRRMDDSVEAGGMTLQDRAALNEALEDEGRQERAQRAAVTRQYAGTGSQGLLAGLVAQQGGAQRAHRAALDQAGQAQTRYWQNVRDRFGMASGLGDARSAIDRWNRGATQYNNSLEQQRFDNDFRRAQAKYGVASDQAARKDRSADRTADMFAGVGGVAGGMADDALDPYGRRRKP